MEISEKKGSEPECWTLDLKNGQGKFTEIINLYIILFTVLTNQRICKKRKGGKG